MANPFPGVDPFIEATGLWVGFHNTLIADFAKLLNAALPPHYAALVDVRVELVDTSDERTQTRRPDVGIVQDLVGPVDDGGLAVAVLPDLETATLTLPYYESIPEAYVDVVSLPDRELITSIEVLSPTNKSIAHSGDYLSKRAAMIERGINLVEIDLLLDGTRLKTREPLPSGDFYALVSRGTYRPKCSVYAWSVRQKLPKIPIPLKAPDGDIVLDLGTAFATTYDGGRYRQTLRYHLPLSTNLSFSDREWVAGLVKSAAK